MRRTHIYLAELVALDAPAETVEAFTKLFGERMALTLVNLNRCVSETTYLPPTWLLARGVKEPWDAYCNDVNRRAAELRDHPNHERTRLAYRAILLQHLKRIPYRLLTDINKSQEYVA